MPLLPCLLNLNGEGNAAPVLRSVRRFFGIGLPAHFSSAGLGSKVSTWTGAAVHEQVDDALRLAGEVRLARRQRRGGAVGVERRRRPSAASRPARPSEAMPMPARQRSSRRVRVSKLVSHEYRLRAGWCHGRVNACHRLGALRCAVGAGFKRCRQFGWDCLPRLRTAVSVQVKATAGTGPTSPEVLEKRLWEDTCRQRRPAHATSCLMGARSQKPTASAPRQTTASVSVQPRISPPR